MILLLIWIFCVNMNLLLLFWIVLVQIKRLKLELTCIIILTGILDMDKSWIWSTGQLSSEYENGVEELYKFVMVNSKNHMLLRCSCTDCCNMEFYAPE